jgi:hypothetical protein
MKRAALLLDQQKNEEAAAVLRTALNTLVAVDRATPLPLEIAQAAITAAQAQADKDKPKAKLLLATAKHEVDRARELGYAGKDPEYAALDTTISNLEKQIDGNQDTASAFSQLKEKFAAFFKRQSETEKKAQLASR